jgi:hypothetical protein
MPVVARAAQEEFNPADGLDGLFVCQTFALGVVGHSVKDVGVFRRNINGSKQIVLHKALIALRVIRVQAKIFIHVKRDYFGKRNLPLAAGFDKLTVHSKRA